MLLILTVSPVQAEKNLYVDDVWIKASIPGTVVSAGFMTIINRGSVADRLGAIEANFAAKAELHTLLMVDGVMKMRPLQGDWWFPLVVRSHWHRVVVILCLWG